MFTSRQQPQMHLLETGICDAAPINSAQPADWFYLVTGGTKSLRGIFSFQAIIKFLPH